MIRAPPVLPVGMLKQMEVPKHVMIVEVKHLPLRLDSVLVQRGKYVQRVPTSPKVVGPPRGTPAVIGRVRHVWQVQYRRPSTLLVVRRVAVIYFKTTRAKFLANLGKYVQRESTLPNWARGQIPVMPAAIVNAPAVPVAGEVPRRRLQMRTRVQFVNAVNIKHWKANSPAQIAQPAGFEQGVHPIPITITWINVCSASKGNSSTRQLSPRANHVGGASTKTNRVNPVASHVMPVRLWTTMIIHRITMRPVIA